MVTTRCANCGATAHGADSWCRGRCHACYQYLYRTGRDRPCVPCYQGIPVRWTCSTCGRVKVRRGRECDRCRVWRWRKGVNWPRGARYRRAS